jgi:hypothetical protein
VSNAATVRAVESRLEQARTAPPAMKPPTKPAPEPEPAAAITDPAALKEAFLAEVQKAKKFFYGTVIAQAQRIEFEPDRIVLAFAPNHKAIRDQVEPLRPVLEEIASRLSGKRMAVVAVETSTAAAVSGAKAAATTDRQAELKQQALADKSVQAMLDVFGTEIKEVEER